MSLFEETAPEPERPLRHLFKAVALGAGGVVDSITAECGERGRIRNTVMPSLVTCEACLAVVPAKKPPTGEAYEGDHSKCRCRLLIPKPETRN